MKNSECAIYTAIGLIIRFFIDIFCPPMILDLANLLQLGFDLRNTLESRILSQKIKTSSRQQYINSFKIRNINILLKHILLVAYKLFISFQEHTLFHSTIPTLSRSVK